MTSKENFESLIVEFKDSRDNVLNILKIVLEQNRVEPFIKFLDAQSLQNQQIMKDFIKSKYYEFVESIDNIKECKSVVKETDEILTNLESTIQEFLLDFNTNFIERIKKKEELKNIIKEKEKLNQAFIFFAYMTKADIAVKDQHFELSIRLMDYAYEKFLKRFPSSSSVYKRGDEIIKKLKEKITSILQGKLTEWLLAVSKEQEIIGGSLYNKLKTEFERQNKNDFFSSDINKGSNSLRTTKNIVDSILLIRNTSNLNYMLNKNSVLKSSILSGEYNEEVEFDIINMVSNVDLKFLELAYNTYKAVENNNTRFLEQFRSFRHNLVHDLIKMEHHKDTQVNSATLYDKFFSDILGFIIIQVAVFELYPVFYSKRRFEESMNYLVKELQKNLSLEFKKFTNTTEYITLERSTFVFIKAIERIGISDKIGVDIRSVIIEMMKEKIEDLNIALISKYNILFTRLLLEDINSTALIANDADHFMKISTQYSIILEDSNKKEMNNLIYPLKLPYTQFVIDVNENFKHYVDEIYEFVKPLFNDYDGIIPEKVRDFLKKLTEVFIAFANSQEQDINVITLGQICNNIRYILQSHVFYQEYTKKTCNIKTYVTLYTEKPMREIWQSYEETIYEQLQKKIRKFFSDLTGENWLPDKPRREDDDMNYIDDMISYLKVIYMDLQSMWSYYIESAFKDAMKFTSKCFCELIFDSAIIPKYNYYAIMNLKDDIMKLDRYFNEIELTYKDYKTALEPIKNVLALFEEKNPEAFVAKNNEIEKFYRINEEDVIKFYSRYRNLKSNKELKGKITESEMTSMIKKLKQLMNISTSPEKKR